MTRWLIILMLLGIVASASATVDLTLFNTFALLDSNGTTPLEGIATVGDLVQLILVGPNGVIDPPTVYGTPGGDDALLFTSHVEAGLTTTNTGHLVQSSILYADTFGGNSNAFVRFWNSNIVANANFYGNSLAFTLPAGDAFGLAEYDFAPLSGSARTTDTPFSGASAVPEPSNLFLLGLMIIGGWFYGKHRRGIGVAAIALGLLAAGQGVFAEGPPAPFDVTASAPILNADGTLLPGRNPVLGGTNNCLVQVISVGPNGVVDLPNANGTPGGDDTVLHTTVIGQGINPGLTVSARFSTSFYPPPAEGAKVYARVFNAATIATATHWGQSATFTVENVAVFDLSALGVSATTQPKGSDPTVTDSDGDGQTDYKELIANTNPLQAADRLDVSSIVGAQPVDVNVSGKAGRQYTLQRSTDDLSGSMTWSDITTSGLLSANQNLLLSDPNPPNTQKAFYRIRVTMP